MYEQKNKIGSALLGPEKHSGLWEGGAGEQKVTELHVNQEAASLGWGHRASIHYIHLLQSLSL